MIKVIFHDNKKNRTDKIKSKLEKFSFLKLVDNEYDLFDSINTLIENSKLEESKTIIMHDSDFDSEPLEKIRKLCKTNKIDLVFFTGGNTTKKLRMKEIPQARLSAEHVYSENLFYFLEQFEYNDYKLGYLVFGKDFILNQLLNFRMFLNLKLSQENNAEENNAEENHAEENNAEENHAEENNAEEIYDYLREKIDIDYLIDYLELQSGKENFNKKNIEKVKNQINSKISNYSMYGEEL